VGYNFGEKRAGDQLIYVTDHGKFSRHTGWEPQVSLDGIVRGICKWYHGNRDLFAFSRAEQAMQAEWRAAVRRTA
jgi:UDP-glucose 4-epimerase